MSIQTVAERIDVEKEAIAQKTADVLSETTGEQTNSRILEVHAMLAKYVSKGLIAESEDDAKRLIIEWAEKTSSNAIDEKRPFNQSFKAFQFFKEQLIDIVELQSETDPVSNKELLTIIRKIESMMDHAAYRYVRSLIESFEGRIDESEQTMKKDKKLIADLSVPIIPSIVPNTILVPIVGMLTNERFEITRDKLLHNLTVQDAESIVCDFTGAILPDNGHFQMDDMAHQIEQLTKSVSLMGVEIIYVGFSSRLVQEIVRAGVKIEAETFSTFRTGLRYLANKKNWDLSHEIYEAPESEKVLGAAGLSIPSENL
ncbi:STAS domain-containing protein [Pseudalkalibacillus sp. SCS-8]|uniref:STAS domain-containing protein n=1 Tax=Pseudalkalibacillus nanhaiensis TaxID=3115291 RepID=UPI0032D9B0BB